VTDVLVELEGASVGGTLTLPERVFGLVVFAHGSGSSRFSPRNRQVAETLHVSGVGTLLIDLLTEREEAIDLRTAELRFDIPLLAQRVTGAIDWAATKELPIGLFGASTGAAAALVAAAERPELVDAIVSRGGRPDLAGAALSRVEAPTLFIVGERDSVVLELNRRAAERMRTETRLAVVPGASHLFEEPGALDEVAGLARDWFAEKL
jgi:putative phosphoribosyl transferase